MLRSNKSIPIKNGNFGERVSFVRGVFVSGLLNTLRTRTLTLKGNIFLNGTFDRKNLSHNGNVIT